MILTLFIVFVFISLVMIVIGLSKPTESAQSLIGFFLLFIMGLTIITGNLQYPTGETTTIINSYDNDSLLTDSTETMLYTYDSFSNDVGAQNAHWIGYYMSIAAAIGFIGVIWSLRKQKRID